MSAAPLAGKTIVVTRARIQASQLSKELEKLGAQVIEIPAIEILPPESYELLDAALKNLSLYHWLVVTSVNTVRVLRERVRVLGLEPNAFSHLHGAAVGSATADALRKLGLTAEIVPKAYVGEALLETLRERVAGRRILLARAAVARDVVSDGLREAGAIVDIIDAYRTVLPEQSAELVCQTFSSERLPDAVLFTSSSTVTNFFRLLEPAPVFSEVRLVSIGPVTSATLREHGYEPSIEADPHDIPGLISATASTLRR